MSAPADFIETEEDGRRVLRFCGALTLPQLGDLPDRIDAISIERPEIDVSQVTAMDTVGAWLVHRAASRTDGKVVGASNEQSALLEQVGRAAQPMKVRPDRMPPLYRLLDEMGEAVIQAGGTLAGLLGFFGATLISCLNVIRHPHRFRANAVVQQFELVGVRALAIIGLMSFLVGVVIAQQGAVQLRQFGFEVYTVNLVVRGSIKELGVLMTAIMVAGRSGSAFAAQIGTMKLNEEVDAMRMIGVSPLEALVIPRVLACVLIMPVLGFYAAAWSTAGGAVFCWASLDIPPDAFIQRMRESLPMTDLWQALIKAPTFGLIIALAGCFQGMLVQGDSEQVGLKTTAAVVQAIFLVIVLDALFAVFFYKIGWP
jgi:phospholipid/cholesterol/gamma-HCH transport system permease protein